MRRKHDRMAVAIQALDEFPQRLPQLHIDTCSRLIEYDHGRFMDQRLSDEHAPFHATGQLPHVRIRLRRKVEVMQQLVDPTAVMAYTEIAGLYGERFADGEERIKHQFLRDDTERPSRLTVILYNVEAHNARAAAGRERETRQYAYERRLAGTVQSEQAEKFALCNFQTDPGQRMEAAVMFHDVMHLNGGSQLGRLVIMCSTCAEVAAQAKRATPLPDRRRHTARRGFARWTAGYGTIP